MTEAQTKELLELAKSINSSLSYIQSDISDIKTSLKNKDNPLMKQLGSIEEYMIGLMNSLDNHSSS